MATPSYSNPVNLQLSTQLATNASQTPEVYEDLWQLNNAIREIMRYITSVQSGFAWGGISGNISAQSDLMSILNTKLEDAPEDGKTYGRKDGDWEEVTGGGGGGNYKRLALYSPYILDTTSVGYANYTIFSRLQPSVMLVLPSSWSFSLRMSVASGNIAIGAIKVLTTNAGSLTVTDSFTVTIGGNAAPTLTPPAPGLQDYKVDPIELELEEDKDYYVAIYFTSASNPTLAARTTSPSFPVVSQYQTGNQVATATIPAMGTSTYGTYDFRTEP